MFRACFQKLLQWIQSIIASTPTGPLTGTPLQAAQAVVESLDFSTHGLDLFQSYFDPAGVRYSPYQRTDPTDLTLNQGQFSEFNLMNPPQWTWGIYQGSGDPIELNIHQYFNKFVNDYPYRSATTVTLINTSADFVTQATLINNLLTSYPIPQYRIVEYFQNGSGNGFDWTSLMVVLKDQGSGTSWTLAGLAHGSWTT